MKISVVTVCYNPGEALERTIQSVLGQTHPEVEYVIVDGGSTDGSVDIIKRHASRLAWWVSEPDGGIYDAMNKAISHCSGQYVSFMNAGDLFSSPDVLARMAEAAASSPGLIYGNWVINKFGRRQRMLPQPLEGMWKSTRMCHQAVLFANLPGRLLYDTSLRVSADHELMCRYYYDYKVEFAYVPVDVAEYDLTGFSTGNSRMFDEFKAVALRYKPRWQCNLYFGVKNLRWKGAWWIRRRGGERLFKLLSKVRNFIAPRKNTENL